MEVFIHFKTEIVRLEEHYQLSKPSISNHTTTGNKMSQEVHVDLENIHTTWSLEVSHSRFTGSGCIIPSLWGFFEETAERTSPEKHDQKYRKNRHLFPDSQLISVCCEPDETGSLGQVKFQISQLSGK
jgi:hypothetical protein